jgi:hypothetical protein
MKKLLLVPLALTFGCAAPLQQRASIIGQSSKVAVDETYGAWDKLANDRVSDCEHKLDPDKDTKSDYDKCVGPYNEGVQQKIVTALKAVQGFQLALFLALAQDKSDPEVRKAMVDLTLAVTDFIKLVQANQE